MKDIFNIPIFWIFSHNACKCPILMTFPNKQWRSYVGCIYDDWNNLCFHKQSYCLAFSQRSVNSYLGPLYFSCNISKYLWTMYFKYNNSQPGLSVKKQSLYICTLHLVMARLVNGNPIPMEWDGTVDVKFVQRAIISNFIHKAGIFRCWIKTIFALGVVITVFHAVAQIRNDARLPKIGLLVTF